MYGIESETSPRLFLPDQEPTSFIPLQLETSNIVSLHQASKNLSSKLRTSGAPSIEGTKEILGKISLLEK